ncbi:hypothetical protein PHMEG_00039174 [Phytophthora megakarya]|uniref:Uncharacterized protein n=1 Tax=Phytophthora megakarya TaxID=4795 RepID=A0A225UHD0_9STRA|nr:hypothetical protein PHMEG_00039174 [Phytophthora megakarya]
MTAAWKIWICKLSQRTCVFYNHIDRSRVDGEECVGPLKSVITTDTKKFILQQDECAIPPQLILSNMHTLLIFCNRQGIPYFNANIKLRQIFAIATRDQNLYTCCTRASTEVCLQSDWRLKQRILLWYQDGENGYPYIGKGTDADSFVVGVISISLVMTCIEYVVSSYFILFHADATFNLSDLGYPSADDGTRIGHVSECFSSGCDKGSSFSYPNIDAVMGNATDGQVNGFEQLSPFSSATYLMGHRKGVMDNIVRIHFTDNMTTYFWLKIPYSESGEQFQNEQVLRSILLNSG